MIPGRLNNLSRHFHLHELADGVYAALHRQGGQAISNAGLVDLGERVVVFDTFLSPQAAIDLKLLSEDYFNHPVDTLVNSHYHNDHVWGNQAFHQEVEIISTSATRSLMESGAPDEYRWYREHGDELLRSLEAEHKPGTGESPAAGLWRQFVAVTMDVLPRVRLRAATLTFNNRLSLHGTKRTAELLHLPGGHTDGDLVMFLPQDGVLFAGDLVSVDCHPYLPESKPGKTRRNLEQILGMGAQIIVPGHGSLGTGEQVESLLDYLEALENRVRLMLAENDTPAAEIELPVPAAYQTWEFPDFYRLNARFLARALLSERASSDQVEAV